MKPKEYAKIFCEIFARVSVKNKFKAFSLITKFSKLFISGFSSFKNIYVHFDLTPPSPPPLSGWTILQPFLSVSFNRCSKKILTSPLEGGRGGGQYPSPLQNVFLGGRGIA